MHPSAHFLAATIGHVLAQLDPSSAHLKAGSTCKQKTFVIPASRKDMASADKHQGSCSSKPVGADSLDDEEEESFFELNQLVY